MRNLLNLTAILACLAGAHAQVNYSTNIVGFYSLHVSANQPVLIANQLNTVSNTLSQLLPGAPPGATLSKFDGGYTTATLRDGAWDSHLTLNPGEGGLYTSPADATLTFCGAVLQGSLTNTLPAGEQVIRSAMVPLSGRGSADLGIPGEKNDTLALYAGGYTTYTFRGSGWNPGDPVIGAGQAWWYQRANSSDDSLWVQSFVVTPISGGGARLDIAPASGGQFTLTLSGASGGTTYYVMSKPLLTSTFWSHEATIAGNSSTTVYASGRDSAYFRAICATADTDGDGIPDWWMMKYFGHPTGKASDGSLASSDPDGDGLTNLQEYIGGTNPRYPNSTKLFISSPKPLNLP
jgi:hypothetical protein